MALNFPSSPALNDEYTSGNTIWKWNGAAWQIKTSGTVSAAINIAGGDSGEIPYQTGVGTTAFVPAGSAGQVLTSNGTSAPSWTDNDGGIAMAIALG